MQSQLIFLIALAAGCTTHTFQYQTPGQPIPNYWKLTIKKILDVDLDEILHSNDSTVVILKGKNFIQLKDGRLVPVDLKPIGINGFEFENVNKDFNLKLKIPLKIGLEVVTTKPTDDVTKSTLHSERFIPSQRFVYISRPGDDQEIPCWEIDYGRVIEKFIIRSVSFSMLFTIHKASECF